MVKFVDGVTTVTKDGRYKTRATPTWELKQQPIVKIPYPFIKRAYIVLSLITGIFFPSFCICLPAFFCPLSFNNKITAMRGSTVMG
uniref:Uncharacterized protein n=1 Tax=Cucumis melo TaxID=3656 RepID=A0A9I9EC94_CUCME